MLRKKISDTKKIVVKIGTKVLIDENRRLNYPHIEHLVKQLATLHKEGRQVVLVTSGAIAAGMDSLKLKTRPKDLPTLQACAAVGQVKLMRIYEDLFLKFSCSIAQVLLTHDDLKERVRHVNIKQTFKTLLKSNIIPIVNENDTVSVQELKFGDNDILASLVAMLLEAQVLLLLTTAPGFLITKDDKTKECLSHIENLNSEIMRHIEDHKPGLSLGGMKSKLLAAFNMDHVGGLSVIACGLKKNAILEVFSGQNIGTIVGGKSFLDKAFKMPGKKRWIAFYNRPIGTLIVDEGAKDAIMHKGKSLLAVGIKEVFGNFKAGSVVEIKNLKKENFAKGIVNFSSDEISLIKGHDSKDLLKILPEKKYEEVIHRDSLVLFFKENHV